MEERQARIGTSIGIDVAIVAIPIAGRSRPRKTHYRSVLENKINVRVAVKCLKRSDNILDYLDNIFPRKQNDKRDNPSFIDV